MRPFSPSRDILFLKLKQTNKQKKPFPSLFSLFFVFYSSAQIDLFLPPWTFLKQVQIAEYLGNNGENIFSRSELPLTGLLCSLFPIEKPVVYCRHVSFAILLYIVLSSEHLNFWIYEWFNYITDYWDFIHYFLYTRNCVQCWRVTEYGIPKYATPNMPLWHSNYFEAKAITKKQVKE